jgi:hypothetical protein
VSFWKKYRYNKNPQNKTKYEEARTEANRLVRKAKYEYERTIAINMKEDNKIFWKFIKSKTKSFLFLTSAILLSSFIQGVSYFLDIDLLSGMFSSYIIFNSSANLCHNQPSLLDLIFTNEEGMIDTIEHNAPQGNSDHETLEFNFRFGIKQKKHYQNKLCWFKGKRD